MATNPVGSNLGQPGPRGTPASALGGRTPAVTRVPGTGAATAIPSNQSAATAATTAIPSNQDRNAMAPPAIPVQPSVAPAATTAAPPPQITANPADAQYLAQIAALNLAYNGSLNTYNRGMSQDQAAHDLALSQLTAAEPQILRNTMDAAQRQGLLESGILGQREALNITNYTNRAGALNNRLSAQRQALNDMLQAAQGRANLGGISALNAAEARRLAALLAASPNTPAPAAVPAPLTAANPGTNTSPAAVGTPAAGSPYLPIPGMSLGNITVRRAAARKAVRR